MGQGQMLGKDEQGLGHVRGQQTAAGSCTATFTHQQVRRPARPDGRPGAQPSCPLPKCISTRWGSVLNHFGVRFPERRDRWPAGQMGAYDGVWSWWMCRAASASPRGQAHQPWAPVLLQALLLSLLHTPQPSLSHHGTPHTQPRAETGRQGCCSSGAVTVAALTRGSSSTACSEAGLGEWGHQARLGKLESWRRPGPSTEGCGLQAISSLSPSQSAEGHHPMGEARGPKNQPPGLQRQAGSTQGLSELQAHLSAPADGPRSPGLDRDLPEGPGAEGRCGPHAAGLSAAVITYSQAWGDSRQLLPGAGQPGPAPAWPSAHRLPGDRVRAQQHPLLAQAERQPRYPGVRVDNEEHLLSLLCAVGSTWLMGFHLGLSESSNAITIWQIMRSGLKSKSWG